jgi:hypothetical protein
MHTTKDEIEPQTFGEYEGRTADFGNWRVAWETLPAGFPPDPSPFKGLPDDRCQCEHLGVVVKGSFQVTYTDGSEELVGEGEAYRLEPGHFVQALELTEVIEFSPREEHERTMQQVFKNVGMVSA